MGTAGSGRGFALFCVLYLFVAMPLGFFGGCIYRLLQGLKGKADGAIVAATRDIHFSRWESDVRSTHTTSIAIHQAKSLRSQALEAMLSGGRENFEKKQG